MVEQDNSERRNPLDKTAVCVGLSSGNDAREAEIGGPLTNEVATFVIDVYGSSSRMAKSIAYAVKARLDDGEPFPVLDHAIDPPTQFDSQIIDATLLSPVNFTNPEPHRRHWYVVSATMTMVYNRAYLS
jgi:hypothetical protein